MTNRKRTKQVRELINHVNNHLKVLKVKDVTDNLFLFICNYLLEKRMYEGFNFYKSVWDETRQCEVSILAGSCVDYDYLQIF